MLPYLQICKKDIFLFLLDGRRLGEVFNLKWEYLDLNQGIVYYPATHNKSRKHLSYELTTDLVNVLKEYQLKAINLQGTVFINPNTNNKLQILGELGSVYLLIIIFLIRNFILSDISVLRAPQTTTCYNWL